MILALVLCFSAAAILARLMFSAAIYALPVAVGVLAGPFAYGTGAGLFGAALVALATAAITYAVGQVAIEHARSPALRAGLLFLYVAPAGAAGFALVHGIAARFVPDPFWQILFASIGGIWIGFSAFARMTAFAPPGRVREEERWAANARP